MVRPIPHRLIRAELVTIYPIDTATTLVDALAKTGLSRDVRLPAITIPAQLEYGKEETEEAPLPGAYKRSVTMVLRAVDCARRSYTPKAGDLVTSEAFHGAGTSTDRLYIDGATKHVEGQGWICPLSDKAPVRRS